MTVRQKFCFNQSLWVTCILMFACSDGALLNPSDGVQQEHDSADYQDTADYRDTAEVQEDLSCGYDCLNGTGDVQRSVLSIDELRDNTTHGQLIDFGSFFIPDHAANPSNTFHGLLSFEGVEGGWEEIT